MWIWLWILTIIGYFVHPYETHTPRIICISGSAPRETRSIDFESSPLHDDTSSVSLNPNFMPFQSYYHIEIKGSCRAFILLHCFTQNVLTIYLWNPSTGFHKIIPSSPFGSNLLGNYYYGLGYDQSTNDYLLVSMSYDDDDSDSYASMLSHLEFFSLKANTWKEIENTRMYYLNFLEDHKSGLLFNETLHWFGYRHDDLQKVVIVAFDLMEMKLFDMHLPDDFYYILDDCGLWVSGEFLGVWAMDDNTVEIWVMKEYKVHSSWTKTIVLPLDVIPDEYFIPLCSTKSGDTIGSAGFTGLAKYNDKGQLLEYHSYCNNPCGSQMVLYTESLLSLPPDNEQA